MLYLCNAFKQDNEQKLFTYSPTRYYYSLAKQVEVSMVCSKLQYI